MGSTLSPSNAAALKSLSKFDEKTIKKIVDLTFKSFVNQETESDLNEAESKAQIGFATLIAIFVRQASSPDSLKPILQHNGIPDASVNYILDLYKANVDLLRAKLANVGFTYPRIIGCEWRLDYNVSNSESGSILAPLFFIKLNLEGGDSINFTCNEEEMTALVAALKDASLEASRTTN
ncbi:COMM domain-containing protein 3 [Histomonas meleagridis]|uniref:COMM domain-containing protein 3 n=1 Tax=Histomonas meleagridis TaxID=135588 RepID=UPI00355AA4F4|nr:COMM domain-containing protein 3 [Histomonas meleagridis]KAH0807049.1 COMM domain-containing protein 3 [Histomonas meleagridis]